MRLKFPDTCLACPQKLPAGSEAEGLKIGRRWNFLCPACCAKVARPGRTPQRAMLAILAYWEDPCLGDRRDAIRLTASDLRDIEILVPIPRLTILDRVGLAIDTLTSLAF